jgi:hypothetical protein
LPQDSLTIEYSLRHCIWLAALLAALATQSVAVAQNTDAFVAKIPGSSMTSSVSLSLASASTSPGATVQIPLNLTSLGTALPATFQMDLSFDTSKLSFASAQIGTQLTNAGKSLSSTILANGNVRLLTMGVNQTAVANGLAATVLFTVKAPFTTGSSLVSPLNCISSSGQGSALATGCTASTVTISSCDINGDGVVNVVDVQLIINQALGIIPAVSDLNHDGVVNVADVQIVINAALGLGCLY